MIATESRPRTRGLLSYVGLVLVGVAALNCQPGPSAQKTDLETLDSLIASGFAVDDPFAQAETARALAVPGSPKLVDRVRPALEENRDPMVRSAAVDAVLSAGHPEASRLATAAFNDASPSERIAILRAAVDHGPAKLEKNLAARAIRSNRDAELRRVAFEESVAPRLRRAVESGETDQVKNLRLPKLYNDYTRKLDPVVGGDILALSVELGGDERVDPIAEILGDPSESTGRRLKAARILADAGSERALPAFSEIINASKIDADSAKLAVPEPRIDRDLLQASVLGMVACGDRNYVAQAKNYMTGGDADRFIRVLEALASNPAEGARLALENAMTDARPAIRHRAIELYGERADTRPEPLFDALDRGTFNRGDEETRFRLARFLAQHFPDAWVDDRLANQLESDEGIDPALERLKDVWSVPAGRDVISRLEEKLVSILDEGKPARASDAAFLLIKTGHDARSERLRAIETPAARYAYLERAAREAPDDHVGFFLDNLYSREGAPELFSIRLMAGVGLWASSRDRSISEVVYKKDAGGG